MSREKTTMLLSEFIEFVGTSISKRPKVKNHDQLVGLKPKLEKMLKDKGDVEFPIQGLMAAMGK